MKVYKTGQEARTKVIEGINKLADALKQTYGSNGGNATIKREFLPPLMTNDAKSIIDEFELDDELEDLGREVLKQAVDSVHDLTGDGRKTTSILFQAILKEGFKKVNSIKGDNKPMAVRKEILDACKVVISKIKPTEINTEDEIANIATIASESKEIGKLISRMFVELGKDALITVQDGFNGEIETEVVKGADLDAGLPHKVLSNNDELEYRELNPSIIVTNHPIESVKDIKTILQKVGGKSLVLICEHFAPILYDLVIQWKLSGEFNLIPIKAPTVTKSYLLEDLAILLNTELCDKELHKLEEANIGTCGEIIVAKGKTTFLEVNSNTKDRIKKLEDELKQAESLYDKDKLKNRINKLSGGIGIIRVDGFTDTERGYLKLKIKDAVNATRKAMEGGVVKGAGYCLKEISDTIETNILSEAIKEPYRIIYESGIESIDETVIDPFKVVKASLEKACSQAGLVLTTEIAIATKREKKKNISLEDN